MLGIIEYSKGGIGLCVSLQRYISALHLVRISIVNLVLIKDDLSFRRGIRFMSYTDSVLVLILLFVQGFSIL